MKLSVTLPNRSIIGPGDTVPRSSLFGMLAEGRREWTFWVLQILFWSNLGLVGFLAILVFRPDSEDAGRVALLRVASGFLITLILRGIYRRPELRLRRGFFKWIRVIGCCLALGILEVAILKALSRAGVTVPGGAAVSLGSGLLGIRLFSIGLWSLLYFSIHLVEDEHALELRLVRTEVISRENELKHLQAKMNPHFLFNALNAVLATKHDPVAVEEVTLSLADYLRFSLSEARPLEPLSRELDALEKYLIVQASRFGDNLICRIQCDTAARPVLVPPMIIQPLLENAFHYGSQTSEIPLRVDLTARLEGDFLKVTVANTGHWVPPDSNRSPGSGIRTLCQRLTLLHGPLARVEQHIEDGWVRITSYIPLTGMILNPIPGPLGGKEFS